MKICDLHTHSRYSDGTDMPADIISLAIERGLSAVALCDHNNVDGLPEFLAAAKGKDIEAVAGAEFSVEYDGGELHLLGLYIPEGAFDMLSEMMQEEVRRKEKSNLDLISSLQRAGYDVDLEAIRGSTMNGQFNRVQIAEELIRKGYISSIKEGMVTILSEGAGHYRPRKRIDVWSMLKILVSIGAVPVLAHPLKIKGMNEARLRRLLPQAKERGLVGMECYYSEYSDQDTAFALSLAKEYGLKCSGGSDYHGTHKPHIQLGTGCGNLKIPYEWAVDLKSSQNK